MNDIRKLGFKLRQLLNKPFKVALICAVIFVLTLFVNGTLWRVWGLRRDEATILEQIKATQNQATLLDLQIKQAKDPSYIERQARDRQDMVSENDLVFVFSE
ncbi:MAG: hypothetical protein A2622_08250 [Bdellovibrionales bacterium RIFCSPHIGHO2_01_FULL_40_29]|nr:MAG: hypothetical protein A2622_08250 [Bdellovibrionales bacterium RIFCSPHIGHO2_01_FULL_40_29]OFZ35563.1 MAG: hypothetical protein A3D17_07485 [Bdellovibrionales bacterium RIFCSPHIGHO2_02_FULL_40_15]